MYTCNRSMVNTCFSSSDGDMLVVPETGILLFRTELGNLVVPPGHIIVVPRGIRFSVQFTGPDALECPVDGTARGYILEVFSGSFELPTLGLVGANGLANPRDFRYPTASFTDEQVEFLSITKFQGAMFKCRIPSSPFDVVAWHGNYAPFAYDLSLFCPVNTVLFDHADPSIFTVLTVPSPLPGVAVADFVIFPPRWATQQGTMRLPYFHRNCMTEFMGVISGSYEAKDNKSFGPGSATLHSAMAPHGPDAVSVQRALSKNNPDEPERPAANNLAFMFETYYMVKISDFAITTEFRDDSYVSSWHQIPCSFDRNGHRDSIHRAS